MTKKTILIFFLIGFSLKYFDATIAQTGILKNLSFGFMFISIVISLLFFFKKNVGFIFPIQLISISIVISIFMAKYTWGQGLQYCSTTIPFAIWFVFFGLLHFNVPIKTIENVVLFYGIIYIVLFLFQLAHSGTVYFGYREEFVEDRGIIRINFPGAGVFFLSYFIAINKATNINKFKFLWIVVAIIGMAIMLLQVTRQAIFVMVLFFIFHFMKNMRLPYKIVTIVLFFVASYIFLNSGGAIVEGLVEQQKVDASYGKDYVRILSAKYYLTQFTPNTISKIFGNGFSNNNSNYGKTLIALNEKYGYYLSDVGLVEVYISCGVFAIFGFLMIFIKSIFIPLPKEYYYLKYYLWMVMITSLTSNALISYNFIVSTVLVLYSYQRIIEYKLEGKVLKNHSSSISSHNSIFRH